nr:DUF3597 domain-containing protein [Chlorobium limicola]
MTPDFDSANRRSPDLLPLCKIFLFFHSIMLDFNCPVLFGQLNLYFREWFTRVMLLLFLKNQKEVIMGIFSSIMNKLGFGGEKKEVAAKPVSTVAAKPAAVAKPAAAPQPVPVAISEVDVVAKLEALASAHTEKLNWKTSIVDLMKLLGLDSSLAERKELAVELGCPAEKMGDSAQMNMWLHKTVLKKLAENGGNIPKDLLD